MDRYEDGLGNYLVKLGSRDLSERDSHTISMILHCIGDFERISDHAVNIMEAAQELQQKKLVFSRKAREELEIFTKALLEIMDRSVDVFEREDCSSAVCIEPLEETIDVLSRKLRKRHVERLRAGECTIELGFVLSDLITDYERISDHCSNVAIALIQSEAKEQEAHEYAAGLHRGEDPWFQKEYEAYRERYRLP